MNWDATVAKINGPAPAQLSPDNRGSNAPFVFSDPEPPIGRLKGAPARKFRELIEMRNAARASLAEITERQNSLQQARFESERALASIIRLHRMNPDSGHPSIVQLRERIDRAELALKDLQPFCESRAAVAASVGGLVDKIERWITDLPDGIAVAVYGGPLPKLGKNPPAQIVERCRGEIIGLRQEYQRVAAAPLPTTEAKKLTREKVAALATRGRPDLGGLFVASVWDGSQEIQWPVANVEASRFAHGANFNAVVPDSIAVLAWLFPDQMIARLEAEIDARGTDGSAMTDQARVARMTQLAAEILDLERAEELAIELTEREGAGMLRRSDASPLAVLGLSAPE